MLLVSAIGYIFDSYPKNLSELNIETLNEQFEKIAEILKFLADKLSTKGIEMPSIYFRKANSVEDLIETYNFNISQLTKYLSSIESNIQTFSFTWDDVKPLAINFNNMSYKGTIEIDSNSINISIQNDTIDKKITIDSNGEVQSE